MVRLSPEAKKELEWWRDYLKMSIGKSILPLEELDTIFTDAFNQGLGAHLNLAKIGVLMELGGKGKNTHKYARVKSRSSCFASFSYPTKTTAQTVWHRQQHSSDLHQQIGGYLFTSSDISYLRDVESCGRQRLDFVSSICSWRGKSHSRKKSRVFQGSPEWMLHPAVFQELQKEVGCFDIDLFATLVNHQVPAFVSWRSDPGAVATDAFNVKWDFQLSCLFPPFCMIKRCLRKINRISHIVY